MQMFRWSTEEQVPEGHRGQSFRILKESKLILNQHKLNVKQHGARLSAAGSKLSHTAAREPSIVSKCTWRTSWDGSHKQKIIKKRCINRLSFLTGNDMEKKVKSVPEEKV